MLWWCWHTYRTSPRYIERVEGIVEARRAMEGHYGRRERYARELPEWLDYVLAPVVVLGGVALLGWLAG